MVLLLSLLVGLAGGFWRRGWIAVVCWALVVTGAVLLEVQAEEGMALWWPAVAGASALGLGVVGLGGGQVVAQSIRSTATS